MFLKTTTVRQVLLCNGILFFGCLCANGLSTHHCPSGHIEDEVAQLRYDDMALDVGCLPPGLMHDLYQGVLYNRMNRMEESARLLRRLASNHRLKPPQKALVLSILADDDAKTFDYREASDYYNRLLSRYSDQLSHDERLDKRNNASVLKLLRAFPKQTIAVNGLVDLPTVKDPHGVYRLPLTLRGVSRDWIIDTGADYSVVSECYAKELGLKISEEGATTPGFDGIPNSIHVAIVDRLSIGSATIYNMVVLVLPDANLTVSNRDGKHIIPALLGYPALQAFGKVRLTANGRFLAGPALIDPPDSSPMYMDDSNILLRATIHNEQKLFQLDTGANTTVLYSTYLRDFPQDSAQHRSAGRFQGSGVGGLVTTSVEYIDKVGFTLAGQLAMIAHVPVQLQRFEDPSSRYEGNIGCDLLSLFDSVTFDFTQFRFYLEPSRT
jgi:hypothetical protein